MHKTHAYVRPVHNLRQGIVSWWTSKCDKASQASLLIDGNSLIQRLTIMSHHLSLYQLGLTLTASSICSGVTVMPMPHSLSKSTTSMGSIGWLLTYSKAAAGKNNTGGWEGKQDPEGWGMTPGLAHQVILDRFDGTEAQCPVTQLGLRKCFFAQVRLSSNLGGI